MEKTIISFILFTMMSVTSVYAKGCVTCDTMSDDIVFVTSYFDPTLEHGSHPKSPIAPPSISLDDHTLYFDTPCDGCTLNIVDENNVVVYTLVIPTGTTSLVLPSTLSGDYTIQIIRGYYLFYGSINLL